MALMKMPKLWTKAELCEHSMQMKRIYIESRRSEGLEYYQAAHSRAYSLCRDLFAETDDLASLSVDASQILANPKYLQIVRYLASPPISEDDIKIIAEVPSLSSSEMSKPDNARRVVELVFGRIHAARFPWLQEKRLASDDERNFAAAITAVLIATQETQTNRRRLAKSQEQELASFLEQKGYKRISCTAIRTAHDAPGKYEYCGETPVAGTKADVVIGMGDGRFLCLECKVSNSEVNSYKRLNHEAVDKITKWTAAFGKNGVVGAALLAGVFKPENMHSAQDEGAFLFFSYRLADIFEFLNQSAA